MITVVPTSSSLILNWVDAIETTEYFTYPASHILEKESNLLNTIFALCTTITIAFFDFDQDLTIEGASKDSYINNPDILTKLHKNFTSLLISKPSASPVIFGWSFILNIVAARLAEFSNPDLDSFLSTAIPRNIPNHNSDFTEIPKYELLMRVAADIAQESLTTDPFKVLEMTFSLLPQDPFYAAVFKSYLKASLPYISLNENLANCVKKIMGPFPRLSEDIFTDTFGDRLYTLAALRFPAAIGPFVKLSQCLGVNAYDAVSNLFTFMQQLPKSFTDYNFVGNSSTTVELTKNIFLLPAINEAENSAKGAVILPPKIQGTIHVINHIRYVIWQYKYNGWPFLGCLLERACNSSSISQHPVYDETVVEIIRLLTSTLSAIDDPEKAKHLLTLTTESLMDTDIVDLIFKILEDSLFTNNVILASACIDYISTLAPLLPDRVWSFLGRSTMLERNGQQSNIAKVLGSTEIVTNTFDLTISVLKLIRILLDSAVESILVSKVSSKVRTEIISKFVRHTVAIFESFAYWAYSDPRQKVKIAYECVSIFGNLLHYSFDVDEHTNLNKKVTSVLSSATEYLVQQFLTPEKVISRALKPLIGTIESSAWSVTNLDTEYPLESPETVWIFAALNFASELVKARSYLELPPSQLEKSLFSLSSHLSILYARYPALRSAVMDMFISIIRVPWPSSEQPSLLAHLGMHAHMFISNLTSSLQNGLENESTLMRVALCFSSIIESQQEGLSILLLTGRDTRKASHIEQEVTSLLQVTERKISTEKDLPQELLLPLLRSMASAYSNWKLGTFSSKPELANSLIEFVDTCFKLNADLESSDDESKFVDFAYRYSIAEYALLIFSVQLRKSPNGPGIQNFIQYLESNELIIQISKKFLSIKKLHSRAHENLIKNFNFRWPRIGGLKRFAKTRFSPLIYGSSYIYDISLLDTVLGNQNSWVGYRKEVITGNFTYSWVEAQLRLISGWCTFSTSLSFYLTKRLQSTKPKLENNNRKLMNMLNEVSEIAINSILEEEYSTPVLLESIQHRTDLIFIIKYHSLRCGVTLQDCTSIQNIYNLLASSDYKLIEGISFSGKVDTPSITYRQLLRTLSVVFESLQAVFENNYQLLQVVYGTFSVVIVGGMTAASQAAISNPRGGADIDMVIIISILKKCLGINGVKGLFPKLASLLSESQCIKSVMSLYSYSKDLLNGNEEQIYGELALTFFLEWMNIDQIADQLIRNGLLDLLMESPISRKIHEGGIKPTTNPKLHTLWVNGILPVLLTLLQKVGSRIVGDILVVVDFFSEQIRFTVSSWRNPSEITISVITETTQIILLVDMLNKLSSSPEFISEQLDGMVLPREELVGYFDYLISHPRFLNATLVATSAEEQELVLTEDITEIPEGNKLLSSVQDDLRELRELVHSSEPNL